VTPEAALERAKHHRDHDWDAGLVLVAIEAAWKARPRTVEHSEIMAWPSLHVIGIADKIDLYDLRLCIHLWGLHESEPWRVWESKEDPEAGLLNRLRDRRTGDPWKYMRLRRCVVKACGMIAARLNARVEPLVIPVAMVA
jgi:hypothetical protein